MKMFFQVACRLVDFGVADKLRVDPHCFKQCFIHNTCLKEGRRTPCALAPLLVPEAYPPADALSALQLFFQNGMHLRTGYFAAAPQQISVFHSLDLISRLCDSVLTRPRQIRICDIDPDRVCQMLRL